ncbi:MAG: phage holin family protein [Dehalococcoidales bacterium]|nr:phage holin family protein [Dehalococcoidales bacterium]
MDNALIYGKWFIAVVGAALSWLLGGWDLALQILVIFVVMDYITGLCAAWREKSIDSNVGFYGIAKKVLLFVPIAIGYWLDQFTGQEILRNIAIFFYMANEGISILENLGRCGVDIPPAILEALKQLKNKDKLESSDPNV